MARRNTRDELVEMVLDEARLSTNSSRGVDHRNYVIRLIKNYYEQLAEEYDWPFLRIQKEDAGKDIQAGSRYYDFPIDLDQSRAFALWTKWGDSWLELTYGINPDNYTAFDSDNNDRSDPPTHWQVYNDTQFEIWPLPATNTTGGLRFEGFRKITPLINPQDRCDLDGILIAKFVAAEILAGNKAADAPAKLTAAQARFNSMKANQPRRRIIMGGSQRKPSYVIVGGRYAKI